MSPKWLVFKWGTKLLPFTIIRTKSDDIDLSIVLIKIMGCKTYITEYNHKMSLSED